MRVMVIIFVIVVSVVCELVNQVISIAFVVLVCCTVRTLPLTYMCSGSGVHFKCECPMCSVFIAVLRLNGELDTIHAFVQINTSIVYSKKKCISSIADEQIVYRCKRTMLCTRFVFSFNILHFFTLM